MGSVSSILEDSSDQMQCPAIVQNCSSISKNLVSFSLGKLPSYISITSSSFSCLGSLLILYAYFTLKDIRSGAQKIITLLAVADFFTAFGYIVGSVNFLVHFNHKDEQGCVVFNELCEVQSFITTWSTMCSYCWTCTLAFYFFLVLVYHKNQLAASLLPLYNIISWIAPLLIVFPLLVMGKLGYAPYVASNWCYIKDSGREGHLVGNRNGTEVIVYLFLAGKFWEILSYMVVIVLYVWIKIYLSKTKKAITEESHSAHLARVEKRLLGIPLLYILLRMWGTLQFFFSLAVDHTNHRGCIPADIQKIYLAFGFLQAIGDGGQGWGNAILYIFLSPSIRRRLFGEPFNKCLLATEDKLQGLLETETLSTKSVQVSNRVPSEKVSMLVSTEGEDLNTISGEGQPATGYGIRSLGDGRDSTTTLTTTPRASNFLMSGSQSVTPHSMAQS